jgi:peroxiredoxin
LRGLGVRPTAVTSSEAKGVLPLRVPEQRAALSRAEPPRVATQGRPMPDFALPDVDGALVRSADLVGENHVLLFWNPACGFCQRMLPALRDWEQELAATRPELVLISTGRADVNRSMGLRACVLLDETEEVRRSFGASGTPMAVAVDANGHVASEVVPGAEAVLTLLANHSSRDAPLSTRRGAQVPATRGTNVDATQSPAPNRMA